MRPFLGACSERVNFQPQRLLAGTEEKVYLEDCESRRHFSMWNCGKGVVSAGGHSCVGL